MIEKYYNFDVDRFLIDHDENLRKLSELKSEKEAAADSGGMDYSHVRGSGISDPTAQRAQRREKIDWEIREYQEYLNAYDKLTADLDSDELLMIQYIAQQKGTKNFEDLKNALGYDRTATYDRLSKLRKKLREIADYKVIERG
jgi:hypothetical protein|nr:MAG TPA: putative membrane-associated trancriptional regulator [Caudoviricetes sp.]